MATLVIGLALAVMVRYSLLDFKSDDFYASLKPWYNTIRSMGFAAFATNFSTYNPPYLYLLYLILRIGPDTPPVIGVKIPGLIGDFVCAYFVYRLVKLKSPALFLPSVAAVAVLFAPTMVVNSALWGQADSLYAAGLLACLYYLMVERPVPGMLAYGIALAFKLQALFLVPFLFALFLRRDLKWKHALVVPLTLLAALIPAWIAGRPLGDLLNIYLYQSSQFEFITMNAPTIYTWLPQTKQVFNLFYVPMIIAGVVAACFLVVLIYEGNTRIWRDLFIELALISLILVPFFLPKMHERYFFPADVLSIVLALYMPRFFYVPVVMNVVSFLAYEPFLFGSVPVPLAALALALLVIISILLHDAVQALFASPALTPVQS